MESGNLIIKLENDAVVDDQNFVQSVIQMPCQLGRCILGHSKRSMNNVIRGINGFYSTNLHYGYMDSHFIQETLVNVSR